jgi:hypothetical protein
MVVELYDALRRAGVGEELARDAARAVMGTESRNDLATKADLSDLKADLIKWNVGAMAILTAIFAAIVRLR